MDGSILSEQEEQILQTVKQVFYYPNGESVLSQAEGAISSLPTAVHGEIMRLALTQLGYEQHERAEFVVQSVVGDPSSLSDADKEIITKNIGYNPEVAIASLLGKIPARPEALSATTVSSDIAGQAKVFTAVDNALTSYHTQEFQRDELSGLFGLLSQASVPSLESLGNAIKSFITEVKKLGPNMLVSNNDFPASLITELDRVGLGIVLQRYRESALSTKIRFLSLLLIISKAIIANSTHLTPMSSEDLQAAISLWIYENRDNAS